MFSFITSGSVAYSMIILSLVIGLGKLLSKIKIAKISFGTCWILFIGIVFSHFGFVIDKGLLHFMKEFGLILFVYSIGLQVGPGFFASLKNGGVRSNILALFCVLLSVATTLILCFVTGESLSTMVGVMSGAVTNTPGLGAAQQTFSDITGNSAPEMAMGYAVAYPMGVVGCILSFVLIKTVLYRRQPMSVAKRSVEPEQVIEMPLEQNGANYISRRIIISKRKLNGVSLAQLNFQSNLGATVTRVRRAGIELQVDPNFRLQYGDQLTVVGSGQSVAAVEKVLGNSRKRLDEPNLIPIFIGIALGCVLGSIPFRIPGIPQAIKLGLAAGPLIISILVSHFGPGLNIITYTTASANLMLREVGISIFLACVGLEAGDGFVESLIGGGYVWIFYGSLITLLPVLIAAIVGRYCFKIEYNTLIGILAGSCTNPPALAFASQQDTSDSAAVGYATVYPLAMFFRVLAAQMMVLFLL